MRIRYGFALAFLTFFAAACGTAPGTAPSAGTGISGFAELAGRTWRLVAVEPALPDHPAFDRAAIADGEVFTLSFDAEEGRFSGRGFPNRFFGPYTADGGNLRFGTIAGTLMAAFNEPESLREREYFGLLEGVQSWDLVEGRLRLTSRDASGTATTLVFEAR